MKSGTYFCVLSAEAILWSGKINVEQERWYRHGHTKGDSCKVMDWDYWWIWLLWCLDHAGFDAGTPGTLSESTTSESLVIIQNYRNSTLCLNPVDSRVHQRKSGLQASNAHINLFAKVDPFLTNIIETHIIVVYWLCYCASSGLCWLTSQ